MSGHAQRVEKKYQPVRFFFGEIPLIKKREFAAASMKLRGGPGGWHCPCCNKYQTSARRMKTKARRLVRRKQRQIDTTHLSNEETP